MNLNHKRIVVTFLMHLGDVILTTPFLHVLRQAAPDSHITFVMDEKLREVMQYNPNIDSIVTIDKKGRDNSISALRRIAGELRDREGRPDVVINIHPNERTSFCLGFTRQNYSGHESFFIPSVYDKIYTA